MEVPCAALLAARDDLAAHESAIALAQSSLREELAKIETNVEAVALVTEGWAADADESVQVRAESRPRRHDSARDA